MKLEIAQLDSRNLDDWHYLGALGGRIRSMYLAGKEGTEEQAELNVRAAFAQWVQSPDTVGMWILRDLDLPHIDSPGDDILGHAVSFMRAEAGELYGFIWQMQVDRVGPYCQRVPYGTSRELNAAFEAWAKERGAGRVEFKTPRSPKAMNRLFGYTLHCYQMVKEI